MENARNSNGDTNNNNTNTNNNENENENENNSVVSMEHFNSVASWVSASVISAFFSSLERFSCVNVSTTDPDDDDDDDEEEEEEAPALALSANPHQRRDSSDLPV